MLPRTLTMFFLCFIKDSFFQGCPCYILSVWWFFQFLISGSFHPVSLLANHTTLANVPIVDTLLSFRGVWPQCFREKKVYRNPWKYFADKKPPIKSSKLCLSPCICMYTIHIVQSKTRIKSIKIITPLFFEPILSEWSTRWLASILELRSFCNQV